MRSASIKVRSASSEQLISFLSEHIEFRYKRTFADTTILAGQEYRLRTNSDQFFLIVINKAADALQIDLVSGGGGTGLLHLSLGSETAFINGAKQLINEFCQQTGSTMEEVN